MAAPATSASAPTRGRRPPIGADLAMKGGTPEAPAAAMYAPLPSNVSLIMVGIDDRARPHASRFDGVDPETVESAAARMGMMVIPAVSETLIEIAGHLPKGKLFESGKAFVPFVSQQLYGRLIAYVPIGQRPERRAAASALSSSSTKPATAVAQENPYAAIREGKVFKPSALPADWDKLSVGKVVLASQDRADGWWTAIVTEVKDDGLYVLRWEDWEGFDPFLRRADQLALLHPNYKGE